MNNKWTYNCISIYIGSITRVINMVYKYMVIKILWKWWYMCTINVQVPCSSVKWILAWFSLVDWRLKLSIFDVMLNCKDPTWQHTAKILDSVLPQTGTPGQTGAWEFHPVPSTESKSGTPYTNIRKHIQGACNSNHLHQN